MRSRAGRSDSKAQPLRHQGEMAGRRLGAAERWSNELTPCDPPLQGLSSLEKDNTNVYSKFFLERSIKTRSCLRVTASSVSGLPCLFLQMANFSTGQKNVFTLARTLGGGVLHLLWTDPACPLWGGQIYLCLTMIKHVSLYYSFYSINAEW